MVFECEGLLRGGNQNRFFDTQRKQQRCTRKGAEDIDNDRCASGTLRSC